MDTCFSMERLLSLPTSNRFGNATAMKKLAKDMFQTVVKLVDNSQLNRWGHVTMIQTPNITSYFHTGIFMFSTHRKNTHNFGNHTEELSLRLNQQPQKQPQQPHKTNSDKLVSSTLFQCGDDQPHMADRTPWAHAFNAQGISTADMMAMSEENFLSTCQFLYACGEAPDCGKQMFGSVDDAEIQQAIAASLAAPEPPRTPSPAPVQAPAPSRPADRPRVMPGRTVSGAIRSEQNQEYLLAQEMAMQKEYEEQLRLAQEQADREAQAERSRNEAQTLAAQRRARRAELQAMAAQLPPEPADGVQVAFNMPSQARIMRKFDKKRPCDDLFVFVQSVDEMFDENDAPLEFALAQGPSQLERGKTLEEQGITRRTLVNVMLE